MRHKTGSTYLRLVILSALSDLSNVQKTDYITTMKKKKTPLYEIKLDGPDQGVQFVSVVKDPAIEINWHAFSTQTSLEFAQISEEKRMLAGPMLIPDLKIYRRDADGNEYDVFFSKETIELAAKKFFKSLNNLNINEEHGDTKVPGYIVESWFVDSESDKSKKYGFSLPEGTWFGVIHIEDQDYWDTMIKGGKVRGFSVEGLMGLQQKQTHNMEKFAMIETVDGIEVYTKSDSPMLTVGDEVYVEVEGVESPAPDGEHELVSGMILVVEAGKIVEIKEKVAVEDVSVDEATEIVEEMAEVAPEVVEEVMAEPMVEVQVTSEDLEALRSEMNATIADMATRISALEAALAEAKSVSEEMSAKVEKMSKFNSGLPEETTPKVVELSTNTKTSSRLASLEAVASFRSK